MNNIMRLSIKYLLVFTAVLCAVQTKAQDYKLPAYEKFQLKNGLTMYLMEQKEA